MLWITNNAQSDSVLFFYHDRMKETYVRGGYSMKSAYKNTYVGMAIM